MKNTKDRNPASRGIELTPVGEWLELATYFKGSDNNYWALSSSGAWTNYGGQIRNARGTTEAGQPVTSLPNLNENQPAWVDSWGSTAPDWYYDAMTRYRAYHHIDEPDYSEVQTIGSVTGPVHNEF